VPDRESSRWPLTLSRGYALQVVSPGGFTGGVTAENVLTQRHARYPALADLCRALHLVEKQGLGVDRMYRDMVVLGYRPPLIVEEPGPRVRTRLAGGPPVVPVVNLMSTVRPEPRPLVVPLERWSKPPSPAHPSGGSERANHQDLVMTFNLPSASLDALRRATRRSKARPVVGSEGWEVLVNLGRDHKALRQLVGVGI
jgi:Putative ATP-dependent DNA helicase recG C-terminal